MTPTQRAAMHAATEALRALLDDASAQAVSDAKDTIDELQSALAEPAPVQEPVAWHHTNRLGGVQVFTNEPPPGLKEKCLPLFTAPQAQQPTPPADVPMLTDEEVQQLHNSTNAGNALIRLIEQMYRQKAGLP